VDDFVVGLVVDHEARIERQDPAAQVFQVIRGDIAANGRVDDLDLDARVRLSEPLL
jgi:hypothetical protein